MIAITFDIDWAPTPYIDDTRSLLEKYNLPATFFSTHDDEADLSNYERALHPNYFVDKPEEDIFNQLQTTYSDAVGVRSHALYTHGGLQSLYKDTSLLYESNYIMYRVENISPFEMINGVIQLPIYFMDDFWLTTDENVDPDKLLSSDGLKVFGFHPVHIYLNTPTHSYYERYKDMYQEPEKMREQRYEGFGVRALFKQVLQAVAATNETVATMRDIAVEYRER